MKYRRKVQVDKRTPDQEPELLLQACSCGKATCDRFMMAMLRPVVVPVEDDPETLASVLYVPLQHAQMIVDQIRKLASDKGVLVR